MFKKLIVCIFVIHYSLFTIAQDTVHYTGNTVVNVDYHNGELPLAMGVHNTQIMRANRQNPTPENGYGWTYNHAPMICYWNNQFFVEYLSDSIGESVPPGRTLLMHSEDGQNWSVPTIIFPKYRVPDGTTKKDHAGVAKDLDAVMHQRMGFYVSKAKRLLVLGFYGICLDGHDDPNDGEGIGRVVREVLPDGNFGPIYFLHYNPAWNEKNTSYPFYKTSKNKDFINDCDELMANPLMMMQWVEETDKADPLIPLHKDYKAFNFYHLNDGRVVGLWKNALTSISKDGGKTWPNAVRAPRFVNSNAKIWGQKTSDGKFATVYNPSEFRWPLGISTSTDGLNYTNLLLVNGEISGMRYGGAYKSYGPQYVRGIIEGNGTPPDKNIWVTYSMNKEDIWVSSIPVPVKDKADRQINDVFNNLKDGEELNSWNTFSPVWSQVSIEKMTDGTKALSLKDADLFDYAKAEHLFPETKKATIEFSVTPMQYANNNLQVEVQDAKGTPCTRMIFAADSAIYLKVGYRLKKIGKYKAGEESKIKLVINTDQRMIWPTVDGKEGGASLFFAPLESVQRLVFRTGDTRRFPDAETPTDQNYDVPKAGEKGEATQYFIKYVKTY